MLRTARGERRAFEALYDRTSAKLYGVCLRILNDRQLAEDALHDTFVNVWLRADRFTAGKASVISWLCVIARNAAIDLLRRRRTVPDGEDMTVFIDDAPDPERRAEASSEMRRLEDCIEQLPKNHGGMVRSAYFEGLTYSDIAERLGAPVGTVKSAVRRAIIKLRECVDRIPSGLQSVSDDAPEGSETDGGVVLR